MKGGNDRIEKKSRRKRDKRTSERVRRRTAVGQELFKQINQYQRERKFTQAMAEKIPPREHPSGPR